MPTGRTPEVIVLLAAPTHRLSARYVKCSVIGITFRRRAATPSVLVGTRTANATFTQQVITSCGASLVETSALRVLIRSIQKPGLPRSRVRISLQGVVTAWITTGMAKSIWQTMAAQPRMIRTSEGTIPLVPSLPTRASHLSVPTKSIMTTTGLQIVMTQDVGRTQTILTPTILHEITKLPQRLSVRIPRITMATA